MSANSTDQAGLFSLLRGGGSSKRTSVLAIDLGQRVTKAVHVHRKAESFELVDFFLKDAPVSEKALSAEVLGDHLKSIVEGANYRGRRIALIVGVGDALLRNAELPLVPVSDMRLMLKYNSKSYLQQELPDHVFDCHTLGVTGGVPEPAAKTPQKARVLVGAAKKQTLEQLHEAARYAGLVLDQVIPSLICPANAFELAMPEAFSKEIVALIDVGFKNSTIGILLQGELALSRVVGLGADRLTAGLAEAMGVSYAEAEGIKVGLPEEVQGAMQGLIMPLGRELRASIDFFEHQQDKTVSQIFVSGGSARSQFVVDSLQSELMVPAKSWNPVGSMKVSAPPQKLADLEQSASQLAVATGGALAAF